MALTRMSCSLSGIGFVAVLGAASVISPALCAQAVPTDPGVTPGMSSSSSNANGAVGSHTSPGVNQNGAMAQPQGGSPPVPENNTSIMKDKMFLRMAEQGGIAEVKLGELAAAKGTNDDVRKFGQKMVDDHVQLDARLQPFVEQLGVSMPKRLSKEDQAEFDKLKALSGDDFNREYLSVMRDDHHKDLRAIRDELLSTQDEDLKAAVLSNARVIVEHTKLVDSLATANGVPARPRPQAPKPDAPK